MGGNGIEPGAGAVADDLDSDDGSGEEFGYEPLSDGGSYIEEEVKENGFVESWPSVDVCEKEGKDERPAVFTIAPREEETAETLALRADNIQKQPASNDGMSREDEAVIKSVMGALSLPAPAWAADARFDAKFNEVMAKAEKKGRSEKQ